MQLDDVLDVLRALDAEDVRYALFGALALAAHGVDRATRTSISSSPPTPTTWPHSAGHCKGL